MTAWWWPQTMLAAVLVVSYAHGGLAQTAVVAEYEVRYGPLTVLTLRATSELGSGRYRSTSEMRTVGMVGYLFPWHSSATSEGRYDETGPRPSSYRSQGEYRGQRRMVALDYSEGGTVVTVAEPPADSDFRDAVPSELQQQTVDPLSATLSLAATPCHGTQHVFDGRRRYDVQLTDLGDATVPAAGQQLYRGRARRCRGEIRVLAGFWRVESHHDERPSRIDFWVAAPRPDLPLVPVYVELSSPLGTLSIPLAAIRRASEPVPDAEGHR